MQKLIVDDLCVDFDSVKLIPKEMAIELCRERGMCYGSIKVDAKMLSEFGREVFNGKTDKDNTHTD